MEKNRHTFLLTVAKAGLVWAFRCSLMFNKQQLKLLFGPQFIITWTNCKSAVQVGQLSFCGNPIRRKFTNLAIQAIRCLNSSRDGYRFALVEMSSSWMRDVWRHPTGITASRRCGAMSQIVGRKARKIQRKQHTNKNSAVGKRDSEGLGWPLNEPSPFLLACLQLALFFKVRTFCNSGRRFSKVQPLQREVRLLAFADHSRFVWMKSNTQGETTTTPRGLRFRRLDLWATFLVVCCSFVRQFLLHRLYDSFPSS